MIRIDGNFAQAASRAARRQLTVAYCTVRRAASREASRAARRQRDCSGGAAPTTASERRAAVLSILPVFTFSPAGKFSTLTTEACRALGLSRPSVPWFRSRSACLARAHALRLAHDTCTCDDATRMRREHTGEAPYFMCCTHARTRARVPGHWHVCCLPAQRSRD